MTEGERLASSVAGAADEARGDRQTLPRETETFKGDYVAVMVPKSALVAVVEPETLSQRNILATEGIPPRQYLETLRRPDFDVPITTLGKLRLVDRAAFVAWIRARAVSKPAPEPANDAAELDDVSRAMIASGGRVSR